MNLFDGMCQWQILAMASQAQDIGPWFQPIALVRNPCNYAIILCAFESLLLLVRLINLFLGGAFATSVAGLCARCS